jgi:hypothetical protein
MTLELVLPAFLLLVNFALLFLLVKQHKSPRKPQLSLSAEDLLHDLTRSGGAVLRVEVINPANLMLRSPR